LKYKISDYYSKQLSNSPVQVVALLVAVSLFWFPAELSSLLALISHSTRVLGVNPQTSLVTGMFSQSPELQLY